MRAGNLASVPKFYEYSTEAGFRKTRLNFNYLSTRNGHGDSGLIVGGAAAVSHSSLQVDGNTLIFLWQPNTYGSAAYLDPEIAENYTSSPIYTTALKPAYKSLSVPDDLSLEDLQLLIANWNTDVSWTAFEDSLDPCTRMGLGPYSDPFDESQTAGFCVSWMAGGTIKTRGFDYSQIALDTTVAMSGGYHDVDPLIGAHAAYGTAMVPISRDEHWVISGSNENLRLRRWINGGADTTWLLSTHAEWMLNSGGFLLSDDVSWYRRRWWDTTSFRVVVRPSDGARLIYYSAGPGMATVRTYLNGRLSDPYPIMFNDREYSYQQTRVIDVKYISGKFYAILSRGLEDSSGRVTHPFTSIAYSDDGILWCDWQSIGSGIIPATIAVLGGWIFLVSPGQLFVSEPVAKLGNPAYTPLLTVSEWSVTNGGEGKASEFEVSGQIDSVNNIEPGDEVQIGLTVDGDGYSIPSLYVDDIEFDYGSGVAKMKISGRGIIKTAMDYTPTTDEILESGDLRHVDFELQTVVVKRGQMEREEETAYNGWTINVTDDDEGNGAIAILPQPVRAGNVWAAVRFPEWVPGEGIVFGYVDMTQYSRSADGGYETRQDFVTDNEVTGLDYHMFRLKLDIVAEVWTWSVDLVRVVDDVETILGTKIVVTGEVPPEDYIEYLMPDFAVHVLNGYVSLYMNRPVDIQHYAKYGDWLDAQRLNVWSDQVAWYPVMGYSLETLPAVSTYVGFTGKLNTRARWLQMVEPGHINTIGRTAKKVLYKGGVSAENKNDYTALDLTDINADGFPYSISGDWLLHTSDWMLTRRFDGFDMEFDINLGEAEELLLGMAAVNDGYDPWCAGGISLSFSAQRFSVRRHSSSVDIVAELHIGQPIAQAHVRVIYMPDDLDTTRSFLTLYLDGQWMGMWCIPHESMSGYVGMSGSGAYSGLSLYALPQYHLNFNWNYKSSAIDAVRNLLKDVNYILVERAEGISIAKKRQAHDHIGDLQDSIETLSADRTDEWASIIRVVGAEVVSNYVDPRLIGYGARLMEVDMPYLWTETDCLNQAIEFADTFYSNLTARTASGHLDPRVESMDTYRVIDTDSVLRYYLVAGYNFAVQNPREPRASMRLRLIRVI